MRNKLILFGATLLAAATVGLFQLTAKATVDTTADCDKYAIVWCGTDSEKQFHDRFNADGHYKDHTKVYAAFGIKESDVSGMTYGVVWRNGNVTIGDKVVATNARDGARNLGGTPIAGTSGAAITSTSTFGTEGQRAMIKMVNGVFKFAIITSCGNPVTAKPVLPPPPPKPPTPPTAVCTYLKTTLVPNTRSTYKFEAKATIANGAKVIAYNYYFDDATKQTTTANPITHTYNENVTKTYHPTLTVTVQLGTVKKDITAPACKTSFTIKATPVYSCDKLTVTQINRTNFKFDTAYTVKNATFKTVTYVVRDAAGKEIKRTIDPLYEQTTDGKYTVEAYVTVTVDGQDKTTALNSNCKKPFEVEKVPETPTAVCDGLTIDKITGTELTRTFTGGATVSGGATILGYELDFGDGKTPIDSTSDKITATHTYKDAKEYTAQLYVNVKLNDKEQKITSTDCKVKFTISPKVCNAPNGETYPEGDDRCAPCDVPGKEHLPKGADCYDCTTPGHENDKECVETPPELPQTGMGDNILALFGAGSLIAAVGYYVSSRKALLG